MICGLLLFFLGSFLSKDLIRRACDLSLDLLSLGGLLNVQNSFFTLLFFLTTLISQLFLFLLKLGKTSGFFLSFDGSFSGFYLLFLLALFKFLGLLLGFTLLLFTQSLSFNVGFQNTVFKGLTLHLLTLLLL